MIPQTNQTLVLGLGCDRGTTLATLQEAVAQALQQVRATVESVTALASIDLKADEPGLLSLALQLNCPIHFYPAAALAAVPVPNPSATVLRHTGTPSVSAAGALMGAGASVHPAPPTPLYLEKHKKRGTIWPLFQKKMPKKKKTPVKSQMKNQRLKKIKRMIFRKKGKAKAKTNSILKLR